MTENKPKIIRKLNLEKEYNQFIHNFDNLYLLGLNKLENYSRYIIRCLTKAGIHYTPSDFSFVTLERKNGCICHALVYPTWFITDEESLSKLLLCGFSLDYNFKDLDRVIVINFYEDYEKLKGK